MRHAGRRLVELFANIRGGLPTALSSAGKCWCLAPGRLDDVVGTLMPLGEDISVDLRRNRPVERRSHVGTPTWSDGGAGRDSPSVN